MQWSAAGCRTVVRICLRDALVVRLVVARLVAARRGSGIRALAAEDGSPVDLRRGVG
jgi:hypothetical protein